MARTTGRPAQDQGCPPDAGASRLSIIREWGESIGIALLLALVFKHFVVEAFKIPTKSMEPTLIGDPACGDKILVNKFAYDFAPPKRGDVIVFKNPEEPNKNYIKRLIGLPRDEILITGGDIYVNGTIWRKPRSVQRALWMPVTSDEFLWDGVADEALRRTAETEGRDFEYWPATITNVPAWHSAIESWEIRHRAERAPAVTEQRNRVWEPTPSDAWKSLEDGFHAEQAADAAEPAMVRYRPRKIYDRILAATGKLRPLMNEENEVRDGVFQPRPLNEVDDVRIRFQVLPERSGGDIRLRIEDKRLVALAILPVGSPGKPSVEIRHKETSTSTTIEGPELALAPGTNAKVAFSNVDDVICLEIDGKPAITHETEPTPPFRERWQIWTDVRFGVHRAAATFRNIRLERDIYYIGDVQAMGGTGPRWKIGEREYFVLGDNSPNSKDSRLLDTGPAIPEENLVGEAFMVFWPPKRIRVIR